MFDCFPSHKYVTPIYRELYLDGNYLECDGMLKLLQFIVDQANLEALEKNKTDETFVTTAVNTTNLDEETKLLKTLSEIEGPKKVWVKRNTYL